MLRGPLKGGSPGESTKPSFVSEFVTEADPEIDSPNLTPVARIKEGKNEVININLFLSNTINSGPVAIINQFVLLTPEILLFRGGGTP